MGIPWLWSIMRKWRPTYWRGKPSLMGRAVLPFLRGLVLSKKWLWKTGIMSLHWISAAVRSSRTLPGPFRIINGHINLRRMAEVWHFSIMETRSPREQLCPLRSRASKTVFMLIFLPLLHLKTFKSSWDGWILTGPWHLSPFRLEQMRFCQAAVIWNYTAILKHFRAITTLIWRNIVLRRINRWRERCSTCGRILIFLR